MNVAPSGLPGPDVEPFSEDDWLLTGAQVAELFAVHRRTPARWAARGLIVCWKGPDRGDGYGHRRYSAASAGRLWRDGLTRPAGV